MAHLYERHGTWCTCSVCGFKANGISGWRSKRYGEHDNLHPLELAKAELADYEAELVRYQNIARIKAEYQVVLNMPALPQSVRDLIEKSYEYRYRYLEEDLARTADNITAWKVKIAELEAKAEAKI